MSYEPTDFQTAFEELTKAVYELTTAFEGLSALVLTELAQQPGNTFDKLADRLDQIAEMAGNDRAAITGEEAIPNVLLANMATVLRAAQVGVFDVGKED